MTPEADLGIGFFVPISEEDRESVRQARARHLIVSRDKQDAIVAAARDHAEWIHDDAREWDMRVLNHLLIWPQTRIPPTLLEVRVVMAALRANFFRS